MSQFRSVRNWNSTLFSSGEVVEDFLLWDDKTSSTTGTFSPRNCRKLLVPIIVRHQQCEMFVEMSLRDRLVSSAVFFWNDSAGLFYVYGCHLLPATTTRLFTQNLSSHAFYTCLETSNTTNNLCNFYHSKRPQVSTHEFCSWNDVLVQNWRNGFRNKLCNCTETTPTAPSLKNGISTCLEATIL